MSTSATATGFNDMTALFQRAAEILEDEGAIRDVAHAALRPVADQMYADIHKRSGDTADDIRIGDEPSGPGIIRVGVGFGKRGHIARFLEYGTAHMRAYPFVRPAYDSIGGAAGLGSEVSTGVRTLLQSVLA